MNQTEFKDLIENWAAKHKLIKHGSISNRKSFLCLEAVNDSRTITIDVTNYLAAKRSLLTYPCILLVPYTSKVDDLKTQSASKKNNTTVFILNKKLAADDATESLTKTELLADALLNYLNEYAYRASDNSSMKPLFIDLDNCENMPITLDGEKGTRLELSFLTPFEPNLAFDTDDYEDGLF